MANVSLTPFYKRIKNTKEHGILPRYCVFKGHLCEWQSQEWTLVPCFPDLCSLLEPHSNPHFRGSALSLQLNWPLGPKQWNLLGQGWSKTEKPYSVSLPTILKQHSGKERATWRIYYTRCFGEAVGKELAVFLRRVLESWTRKWIIKC